MNHFLFHYQLTSEDASSRLKHVVDVHFVWKFTPGGTLSSYLCVSHEHLTLHQTIPVFLILRCLHVIKKVFIERQMERWSVAAAMTSVCVFVQPYSQSTRAVKYSVCLTNVFQYYAQQMSHTVYLP